MKIVSSVSGRASQQFYADEVRPERPIYIPQIIEQAVQRYGFLSHSDAKTAAEKGLKLEKGHLATPNNDEIVIESIDIFSDGLICVCKDTEDAEQVLNDVLEWGTQKLNIKPGINTFPRDYSSWIVADFESSLALDKYAEIREVVNVFFHKAYSRNLAFDFQRLVFGPDPTIVPNFSNTSFAIERRGGAPYDLNRFFCTAPLRTPDHIALLHRIEAILTT